MVVSPKMGEKNGAFYGGKIWQCFLSLEDGMQKMVSDGNNFAHFCEKMEKFNFLEIFG